MSAAAEDNIFTPWQRKSDAMETFEAAATSIEKVKEFVALKSKMYGKNNDEL